MAKTSEFRGSFLPRMERDGSKGEEREVHSNFAFGEKVAMSLEGRRESGGTWSGYSKPNRRAINS